MIISCGVALLWSCLFVVLEVSCTWMGIAFSRFGKFSVILCWLCYKLLLLTPLPLLQ
jgi:hypothetical protein